MDAAVSGLAIAACDGERVAQCSMMRPQRPALGTSAPPDTPIPGCDHEEKSHTGTAAHDEAAPLKRTAQHDDGHAKSGGDDGGDGGGGSGGGDGCSSEASRSPRGCTCACACCYCYPRRSEHWRGSARTRSGAAAACV